MKKNLISILILALLVVNVVMTAILMFSVTSTVKKTGALVTNIASILNIELSGNTGNEPEETEVSIVDAVAFDINGELTIPMKKGEGEDKTHYCLISVSFYMNSKHEDYATLSESVSKNESMLKNIIIDVVGSYTMEQAQSNPDAVKADILSEVQKTFGSTFIYKVAFSKMMFQ